MVSVITLEYFKMRLPKTFVETVYFSIENKLVNQISSYNQSTT